MRYQAAVIHAVSQIFRAVFLMSLATLTLGSSLFEVSSRKAQAYEPLLLENEREAVADLLQFLESAYQMTKGNSCVDTNHPQIETLPTSSKDHHWPR